MRKTFYNSDHYPFISEMEANYSAILKELNAIIDKPIEPNNYSTWIGERPNYLSNPVDKTVAWKTLTFRIFGIDYQPNKDDCPTIKTIIDKYPFLVTAEFSLLEPHTHIHPHTGFTDKLLRSHLGLIIPEGDAALKVGDDTVQWETGKVITFDDSILHEAWNHTDQKRVVLMFDFEPNLNETIAKQVCIEVMSKTNDKHLLDIAPRDKWLEWIEAGCFY